MTRKKKSIIPSFNHIVKENNLKGTYNKLNENGRGKTNISIPNK